MLAQLNVPSQLGLAGIVAYENDNEDADFFNPSKIGKNKPVAPLMQSKT